MHIPVIELLTWQFEVSPALVALDSSKRKRVAVPWPHDTGHVNQSCQSPTWQSVVNVAPNGALPDSAAAKSSMRLAGSAGSFSSSSASVISVTFATSPEAETAAEAA